MCIACSPRKRRHCPEFAVDLDRIANWGLDRDLIASISKAQRIARSLCGGEPPSSKTDNIFGRECDTCHIHVGRRSVSNQISVSAIDAPIGMKILPAVLSVTAGSSDIISFLALGGLFTAHITGNLAILAAQVVVGGQIAISLIIAVPVFMAVLGLTRLLVAGLDTMGITSLRPLLFLQFLLLVGSFGACVTGGPKLDPNATTAIVGGMLGVAAMAVQNALVHVSLKGAPATAVMTTNVTRFVFDLGDMLMGRNPNAVADARRRTQLTSSAIVGFVFGCCIGALCETMIGLYSLAVPSVFALLAFGLTFFTGRHPRVAQAAS
jgi:uncharacterized membrane protein YoaK (UPF0700 family)